MSGSSFNPGMALLDGGINFMTSVYNNRQAEKAAETAYKRQLSFYSIQNDYNSPINQRKRLQAAGINPASVAGEIASGQNAQQLSSVPQNEYAQSGMLKLNGLADTLETLARIEKLGAETGLTTAQITSEGLRQILLGYGIDEKRVDILIKEWEEKGKVLEFSQLPEFFRHRNAMYDLDEQIASSKISYTNAQTELANAQTEESKASAQKLVAETGLTLLKQETEKEIAELTQQQRYESKSRTNLNRQEFRFNQITENLRVESLRIANQISASESQKKDIEAAMDALELRAKSNDDGDANWWYYVDEGINAIGNILGVAIGYLVGKKGGSPTKVGAGSGLYVPGSTNIDGQSFARL